MAAFERLLAYVNVLTVAILLVAWIYVLCQSTGWHQKQNIGYKLEMGIFGMDVSQGIALNAATSLIYSRMSPQGKEVLTYFRHGKFGLQEFAEYMCAIRIPVVLSSCQIWNGVVYSSWVFVMLIIVALVGLVLATVCCYVYVCAKPKPGVRKTGLILYGLSVFFFLVGTTQYVCVTAGISEAFPNMNETTLGPCTVMAIILSVLPVCNLGIGTLVLRTSYDEVVFMQQEDQRLIQKQQEMMYGTGQQSNQTQYNPYGQSGQYDQYGQYEQYGPAGQAYGQPYGQVYDTQGQYSNTQELQNQAFAAQPQAQAFETTGPYAVPA